MSATIFEEQVSRKPDRYPWTEQFIESMHNGFWTDKEFNFQSDIQDFKVNLTEQEREMVVRCLSAIGQTHPTCLLYTSPSPRDGLLSRMPSSA